MSTRKQKQQRLIITLFVLQLLLLAGIAAIKWQDKQKTGELPQDTSTATDLLIERPDFAPIKIHRNDNHWQVTEPCDIRANAQRIEPLLGALAGSAHQYAINEVDLDAAGLLKPHASVTIDQTRIDMGETDASEQRRYIRRGNAVEFAPEWILSLVNGGLSALADLTLFEQTISNVRRTEVSSTDEAFSTEFIENWQTLSARQILTWPQADAPMTTQTSQLIFSLQNESELVLDVVSNATYTALHFASSSCAYIIDTSELPVGTHY
ncbi:MAG: DUF4340 domain-containing protein [Granulosicoccus sp.]